MVTILFQIVEALLGLYKWVVIATVVFSWLSSFRVLDTRNRIVWSIGDFLYRLTEPVLRPIRRVVPAFGGLDLSPLILLIIVYALQSLLGRIYAAILTGSAEGLLL